MEGAPKLARLLVERVPYLHVLSLALHAKPARLRTYTAHLPYRSDGLRALTCALSPSPPAHNQRCWEITAPPSVLVRLLRERLSCAPAPRKQSRAEEPRPSCRPDVRE